MLKDGSHCAYRELCVDIDLWECTGSQHILVENDVLWSQIGKSARMMVLVELPHIKVEDLSYT